MSKPGYGQGHTLRHPPASSGRLRGARQSLFPVISSAYILESPGKGSSPPPPPATSPRVFGAAANNEIIILIKHQSWGESLPSLGK